MAIIIKKKEGTGIPKKGEPVKVYSEGKKVGEGTYRGGGGGYSRVKFESSEEKRQREEQERREQQERIEQKSKSEQERTQQTSVKQAQRQIATRKIGVITRRRVSPTGEITYVGIRGEKYTFPSESQVRYTGQERFGGSPSLERPSASQFRQPQAEAIALETGRKIQESLLRRTDQPIYYINPARSKPYPGAETTPIYDVPGRETKIKRYSELTPAERRMVNKDLFALELPAYERLQDALRERTIKRRVEDQTMGGYAFGVIPIPSKRQKEILSKRSSLSTFEERVIASGELERAYYSSPLLKVIQTASSYVTLGFGKPIEQRGLFGRTSQTFVSSIFSIPSFFGGLVLFTPRKAQYVGEGLAYTPTREATLREINPFPEVTFNLPTITRTREGDIILGSRTKSFVPPTGAGARTAEEIGKPEVLITSSILGFFKARADIRTGKSPFSIERINVRTTIYPPKIAEELITKIFGKRGNIARTQYEPIVEYTLQGRNVKPTIYAKILKSENKLNYGYDVKLIDTNTIGYQFGDVIKIRPTLTKGLQETTTAHELIHYKTPRISDIKLPGYDSNYLSYRLSPGEVLAFGLEKRFATKGFSLSPKRISAYLERERIDLFARELSGLRFEYLMRQLLERGTGRRTPTVSISEGEIYTGGRNLSYMLIQVGRRVSGSILGGREDIFFRKTPSGKLEVRYLRKIGSPKIDLDLNQIIRRRVFEYPFEEIGFSLEQSLGRRTTQRTGIDVGKRIPGGGEYFDVRNIFKSLRYRLYGKKEELIGGRDISRRFLGRSQIELSQLDKATSQVRKYIVGKEQYYDIIPTTIEYALQPTYKPGRRVLTFQQREGGLVSTTELLIRPTLFTKRLIKSRTITDYSYERGRYRPIKELKESFGQFRREYQEQLYKSGGSVIIDPFKLALKKETITSIQTRTPIIEPPKISTSVLGEDIFKIINYGASRSRINITPVVLPLAGSVVLPLAGSIPKSIYRSEIYTPTTSRERDITKAYEKSISLAFTPSAEASRTIVPTINDVTSRTRTLQRNLTKTIAFTPRFISPITTSTQPRISPPPPPPPPLLISPSFEYFEPKKKGRRLSPFFKYQPSLVAIARNIKGGKPSILSGLGIRPI